MMDPANYPPRPRLYRGRRRRPNLLHAVLDAVMDFGRALYAVAYLRTTSPGPGGVPQTPPPDSAEDGTR